MRGRLVIVDGLDGSGKGTVINSIRKYYEEKGTKVFDLKSYSKKINNIPDIKELSEYGIIISSEPTFSMVGKVIREEIIRNNDRKYSALTTAHAFALDREILYRKLIIPALKEGKIIFQERGVSTSIVYQPIQLEKLTLRDIINLPGNRLALKFAPDLLILMKVDPLVVMQRLEARHKKDNAIFENIHFQRKIQVRYESEWLSKLFENLKSKVVYLDTNPPTTVEETEQKAIRVWEDNAPRFGERDIV